MFEDPVPHFELSQSTMPSGNVTFVITSQCGIGCSFDLENVKAGENLGIGKSETWTVPLAPGEYRYHCDVDRTGMRGSITVTPERGVQVPVSSCLKPGARPPSLRATRAAPAPLARARLFRGTCETLLSAASFRT